eukprot:jgi/Botrbrau1/4241/Bobra.0044s0036.1
MCWLVCFFARSITSLFVFGFICVSVCVYICLSPVLQLPRLFLRHSNIVRFQLLQQSISSIVGLLALRVQGLVGLFLFPVVGCIHLNKNTVSRR